MSSLTRARAALAEHPPFPAFTCVRPSVFRPDAAWGPVRTVRRPTEWWNPNLRAQRGSAPEFRVTRSHYVP